MKYKMPYRTVKGTNGYVLNNKLIITIYKCPVYQSFKFFKA